MENLTTDVLYPEYKIWEQFVPGSLLEALELDALKSSHPIEVEVGHPSEVDEIFDNLLDVFSYDCYYLAHYPTNLGRMDWSNM